jgi:hypothetical protein
MRVRRSAAKGNPSGGRSANSPSSPPLSPEVEPPPVRQPRPRPPRPAGQAKAPATLSGGRRTSGLAIATFIIAVISPCTAGVLGLVGVIVGILALRQIRRSHGQLKGRPLALSGLILSCIFLIVLPPLVLTTLQRQQRGRFQRVDAGRSCVDRAQQLADAMRRYANDNNDRFPPAASWGDAIQGNLSELNSFQCPARPDLRSGYAFNSAIAGRTKFEVAPETVLLFESDAGWNGSGGVSSALNVPRHYGILTVVLADGTIRQLPPSDIGSLRWSP